MTDRPAPAFRADHVGSLLRPAPVAAARAAGVTGADLRAIEDAEIPALIRMQEDVGLRVVTDGEARRRFWHYDFMGMLTNYEIEEDEGEGFAFAGVKAPGVFPAINGALDFPDDHPMLDHFRFLTARTGVCPKISIPGPSCLHFRLRPDRVRHAPYKDLEVLFADITATYRKAVAGFYAAGCRYLQMDDIFFAYLCDPKHRADKQAAGLDPDWLIGKYADMLRGAVADRPADMTIGMHMCRGNFRSTHAATGAYDLAAEAIFSTGVDVFFMEYDTDRAGGLEPLKLLPKGHQRILPGFITTKTPELESLDWLKARFDEASKHVSLDQLGIAPQCGFASTSEGNAVTPDDQKRKLELVVRCAEAIWGEA